MEDYHWDACEQARNHAPRRQQSKPITRESSTATTSQQPSYTPSTSSITPSTNNIDTTATPASDLSHIHSPLSPSLKSERAEQDSAAVVNEQQAPATPTSPNVPPKKPTLPAWSQPRSWAGLVSKESGASSFTMPQSGDMTTPTSTNPTPSAAPSDIGSPTVTSPKVNGSAASPAKAWLSKQRLTLEAILAESHAKFNAPLTLPRGLINKGNFCFANAILQVLVFCAPFYNLFNVVGKELAADLANTTPLIEAVVQFLREFHLAPRTKSAREAAAGQSDLVTNPQLSEPFVPEFVYEAMRLNKRFDLMRRGHQEDAEEFLGFFLDTLHEELLAAMQKSAARMAASKKASSSAHKLNGTSGLPNGDVASSANGTATGDVEEEREVTRPVSPTEEGWMEVGQKGKTAFTRTTSTSESPITRIFGGKLRSVLRTPGVKDSVTLEPYQPLQLDIQPQSVQTIEDALLNLTVPETIPGVYSPARGGLVDATKQVFIERTPPVLILHLKRFFYDEVGGVQKNVKEVGYSDTLEVGGDMVSPTKRLEGSVKYRLFGVVYHHGRYATGGHYTVDVLRQDGSSWVHFDDTMFNPVASEHVGRKPNPHGSGSMANGSSSGPGHDGLAYLLFYKRLDGTEAQASGVAPVSNPTGWTNAAGSDLFSGARSKAHVRGNGQSSSGQHTRESSGAGSTSNGNRFVSVQHQGATSPSKASSTAGATASPGRKQRDKTTAATESGKSGKGPSGKESRGADTPQQQQQQQSPQVQTRTVPGAAPGKVRKVKS